jgi:hypothetical protein
MTDIVLELMRENFARVLIEPFSHPQLYLACSYLLSLTLATAQGVD